ncbi:DUF3809 family protein [Thermus sp. FJN-A]
MRLRLVLGANGSPRLPLPLEAHLEGDTLRGTVRQENPVLGEVVLPFASRLEGERLAALPLPPPSLRVEGRVRPGPGGLELELELGLVLPEGRSWGERAFGRILAALLLKTLSPGRETPV